MFSSWISASLAASAASDGTSNSRCRWRSRAAVRRRTTSRGSRSESHSNASLRNACEAKSAWRCLYRRSLGRRSLSWLCRRLNSSIHASGSSGKSFRIRLTTSRRKSSSDTAG